MNTEKYTKLTSTHPDEQAYDNALQLILTKRHTESQPGHTRWIGRSIWKGLARQKHDELRRLAAAIYAQRYLPEFSCCALLLKYPSSPLQSTHIDALHKTGLQCCL